MIGLNFTHQCMVPLLIRAAFQVKNVGSLALFKKQALPLLD